LERTERFFWHLCDDYLELVKARAYGTGVSAAASASARAALRTALSGVLRLFAPFLPFVAEEVWSWWQDGSVHLASWPTVEELPRGGDPAVLEAASSVLQQVRKAKSAARISMRTEVARVLVSGPDLDGVRAAAGDLQAAGVIADLAFAPEPTPTLATEITLT
jgi:valyl-tRNA synthetase